MKIYFGKNDRNDEWFEADGSFLCNADNEYYYNYVEFGTNPGGVDEVAIYDGCDRMIPIALEHLNDLIEALNRVKELNDEIKAGQDAEELVQGNSEETICGW